MLSSAKVLGLVGVVLAGLLSGHGAAFQIDSSTSGLSASVPNLGLALVFVLYAYGGWNDAVFVTAEVRDPRRNLPRALILGLLGITVIYLAVNAAYLAVLGFAAARDSATPAADVARQALGPWGAKAISVLVMVSALGRHQRHDPGRFPRVCDGWRRPSDFWLAGPLELEGRSPRRGTGGPGGDCPVADLRRGDHAGQTCH